MTRLFNVAYAICSGFAWIVSAIEMAWWRVRDGKKPPIKVGWYGYDRTKPPST
jgi:hypothetical protein